MDPPNRTMLLLEMNLRFMAANLQLNSLAVQASRNDQAIQEGQTILAQMLEWLEALVQYEGLGQGELSLVRHLQETVRRATQTTTKTDQPAPIALTHHSEQSTSENVGGGAATETIEGNGTISPPSTGNKEDLTNSNEPTGDANPVPAMEVVETTAQEEPNISKPVGFFNRQDEPEDRWDYLGNINTFMHSYNQLMHLLIPNLFFEVAVELHKFDGKDPYVVSESITYPTVQLQSIVTKFLREAPGASLFRRMRRKKREKGVDVDTECTLTISEQSHVKEVVATYFKTLEKYLDPENPTPPKLATLFEKTGLAVKQFSLGPITVEARLTAVIKAFTDLLWTKIGDKFSSEELTDREKVIRLATVQLFCNIENLMLSEGRFIRFLEECKA